MSNIEYMQDVKGRLENQKEVLSDEQLSASGLTKINAFVRSKASANALRVKRHKEKAEKLGLKQINVWAPISVHDVIKQVAERTKEGGKLEDVLVSLAYSTVVQDLDFVVIGRKVKPLTGWKRLIVRFIIGIY